MKNILKNHLTEDEQKVIFFIAVFGFIGLLLQFLGIELKDKQLNADSLNFEKDYEIKFDLNKATTDELVSVKGIGPKRAQDIIAYRNKHPFKSKDELMNIKGIGPKTYAKMEKFFYDFGFNMDAAEVTDSKENHNLKNLKMDVNKAESGDLTQIKGIGPKTAQNILSFREKKGRITSLDQLLEVKGIGEKTLARLKTYLYIADSIKISEKSKNTNYITKTPKNKVSSKKLDINKASKNDFKTIKGIGPKKAERIIKYRESIGGFTSIEQLIEVKGIGSKTLAKIKNNLTITQ